LRSGETQGYYKAMLASSDPDNVKPGMGAKYYKALLDGQPGVEAPDHSSEDDADLVQGQPQPLTDTGTSAPSAFARALHNPLPVGNVESGASKGKGRKRTRGVAEPQLNAIAMPIAEALNAPDTAVADSDSDNAVCVQAMPSQLDQKYSLRRSDGRWTQSGNEYRRLRIVCPSARCRHYEADRPCGKHRGLGTAQTRDLGPREPEAFLIAWAENAHRFKTRVEHQRHDPCKSDILHAFRNLDK
jgi:hypothetical protein